MKVNLVEKRRTACGSLSILFSLELALSREGLCDPGDNYESCGMIKSPGAVQ